MAPAVAAAIGRVARRLFQGSHSISNMEGGIQFPGYYRFQYKLFLYFMGVQGARPPSLFLKRFEEQIVLDDLGRSKTSIAIF